MPQIIGPKNSQNDLVNGLCGDITCSLGQPGYSHNMKGGQSCDRPMHVKRVLMIMGDDMTMELVFYDAYVDACRCTNGVTTEERWAISWHSDNNACHVYAMWQPVGMTEHDVIEAWYKI